MRNPKLLLVLLNLAVPLPAGAAEEEVLQVRTAEDPAVTADPAVCARAGFAANLTLGASVYGYELRRRSGKVDDHHARKLGTATACAQITSLSFPAGLAQNFYVEFDLPEGHFAARGTCTINSNNVPQQGLVIAGCALGLINPPPGYLGGAVTSTSTFNPFRLSGFATGSYWTFQLYKPDPPPGCGDDGDGDDDDHDDHGHH
jgi:hypothetical protein